MHFFFQPATKLIAELKEKSIMKFCEQKRPGRTNLVIIRFYGIFQLVRSASGYLTICFQYVPVRFPDEL
ncbi:MAG TPA: hypothetical protein DDX72_07245 [Ruminococcaceae bacterium]|nr:hypothetical protein [Oscillospiraceae bacterium]